MTTIELIAERKKLTESNRDLEAELKKIRHQREQLMEQVIALGHHELSVNNQIHLNNKKFFDLGTDLEKTTGTKRIHHLNRTP